MSEDYSTAPAPVRAAVYLRVSTEKQGNSIARQRSQVLPYARQKGYEVVGEYADEGVAGDEFERRPGFRRLLEDAQEGSSTTMTPNRPS